MSEQHLSRKEIKHDIREDQVRVWLEKVFLYIADNMWVLAVVAGAVIAVLAAISGVGAYMGHRAELANDALGAAVRAFEAPVVAEGANPTDAMNPTFASDEERLSRAETLFTELREEYGGGPAELAAVYLGRIRYERGDLEGARDMWTAFLSRNEGHMLATAVKLSLLELNRSTGRGEEVVAELEDALAADGGALPIDVVLFELAVTYEELDRVDEARETYQRLGDEYPESPFAPRAQTKLTELGGTA